MLRSLKDAFYAWSCFHLTQRKLHILSLHLQEAQKKNARLVPTNLKQLDDLNNKRRSIQKEIALISRHSDACRECMGKCCLGDRNLFTAIDFMARKYSNNPLNSYGEISRENELLSNYRALIKHFRYFFAIIHLSDLNELSKSSVQCGFLTEKGCSFQFKDRPIHCVIFTCRKFREGLPNNEFVKLANLTKEIQSVEYDIFKLYRKKFLQSFKAKIQCSFCI